MAPVEEEKTLQREIKWEREGKSLGAPDRDLDGGGEGAIPQSSITHTLRREKEDGELRKKERRKKEVLRSLVKQNCGGIYENRETERYWGWGKKKRGKPGTHVGGRSNHHKQKEKRG